MTDARLKAILEKTGIPFSYHHFETKNRVDPPYICWLVPGTDNFAADGTVYHHIREVNIDLYTDEKDPALEKKIEDVLFEAGIFWNRSETYVESEQLYEVIYEFEV